MLERKIRFSSFDGVALEGTMAVPNGGDFSHLVVLTPGVEVDREELGFYTKLATYLCAKGIASFRFEWRCHGYDKHRPLSELTLAGIFNDIDAACATARMSSNRAVPLVIVGQSFCGGMVANWARRQGDEVAATILLAPVLDYVYEYIESTAIGTRGDSATSKGSRQGLAPSAVAELNSTGVVVSWRKTFGRAIINEFRATDVLPPERACWIIHGDRDMGVDIRTSKRYAGTLGGIRLLVVDGADHGFAAPDDDDLTSDQTAQFYRVVFDEIHSLISTGRPSGVLREWSE